MINIIILIGLSILYLTFLVFYIRTSENLKFHNWLFIICVILLISMFIISILCECGIVKY